MRIRKLFLLCLCVTLLLCLGISAAEQDKSYIIRPQGEPQLQSVGARPVFSVVNGEELEALLAEDADLWYEEDLIAVLHDGAWEAEPQYAKGSKWDLQMIHAEAAWEIGLFGDGVTVGVIDSGVNPHVELQENLVGGRVYLSEEDDPLVDNIGHGTFVAGLIAAALDGNGQLGVAPCAKIFSLKCFDNNAETTASMLAEAICDAADVGCKVINMSFGLSGDVTVVREAINYAAEKGCILVASAGNEGTTDPNYPASYPNVIGVGAVDNTGTVADFSQKNSGVDVAAPGVQVIGPGGTEDYYIGDGTSFAAPLVAGTAAALLGLDPTLDTQGMLELLSHCSDDRGEVGRDDAYGYGLLNVRRCVNRLVQIPGDFDGDGQFTVADALLSLRGFLNRDSDIPIERADLNGDGQWTLVDILRLLKMAV